MNKCIFVIALLFMTALSVLTACGTDDEFMTETSVMPVPDSEEPENSGNNGDESGNNNGEENKVNRNIIIRVSGHHFAATLEDNATARAFSALLPMTVTMNEMNGNEKYCYLSDNMPTDSYRPGTIQSGDLMLYGSNCVVLFYETFSSSYSYTRIGRLDNSSGLAAALGGGNVVVTFEMNND